MTESKNASSTTDPTLSNKLAQFEIDELEKGKWLGSGGFSDVYEINAFDQHIRTQRCLRDCSKPARDFMTRHATREASGESRYAVKFLKPELVDDSYMFRVAATDLATERQILSQIEHPHIIKLRGGSIGGLDAYGRTQRNDGYFLVLDKLNDTLDQRIMAWKKQAKRLNKPILRKVVDKHGLKSKQLFTDRLHVMYDLATALDYLHSNNYIHRDLKPGNIGFDVRDDVKLFDFGLARTLPEGKGDMDEAYEMSGKVGTMRYMCPEVAKGEPYNQGADVYSFALLLHEVLSLEKPFRDMNRGTHREKVVKRGLRPTINPKWPLAIQSLIQRGWHANHSVRPSMKEICIVLRQELGLSNMNGKAQMSRRRSTFVLQTPTTPSKELSLMDRTTRAHQRRGAHDFVREAKQKSRESRVPVPEPSSKLPADECELPTKSPTKASPRTSLARAA